MKNTNIKPLLIKQNNSLAKTKKLSLSSHLTYKHRYKYKYNNITLKWLHFIPHNTPPCMCTCSERLTKIIFARNK